MLKTQNYIKQSDRIKNTNNKIYSNSSVDQYHNILPTNKEDINFGRTLEYNLSEGGYGDLIDDMIIVIDLEALDDNIWVKKVGNMIIKNIYLSLNDNKIINITGEYLDIQNNLKNNDYECMNIKYNTIEEGLKISQKQNRIMIPLLLSEKIPVGKENLNFKLYIDIQEKDKCIKNITKELSIETNDDKIKNISLLTNYINLSDNKEYFLQTKEIYIYNNIKLISKNITQSVDLDYCLTIIPLDSFDYIKDIIIVVHSYDDIINSEYLNYTNALIDAELVIGQYTLFKLDNMMLNKYLPIKYFNKKPNSNGIYYYSFSTRPKTNNLFNGLNIDFSKDYKVNLVLKTLKINGFIHIYSNNYFIASL